MWEWGENVAGNGVNIRLFLHGLSAGPADIAYIHGKVHAIGGYLPMRWMEYDHEEVPISTDRYFIHACGLSMGAMQHKLTSGLRLGIVYLISKNHEDTY